MFKNVVVLGAGSAGLLMALSIKKKLPNVSVRVIRSQEIGVIGVGESTTPNVPYLLLDFLQISPKRFYAMVEPTWKMGIRFLWGPRDFDYSFDIQLDVQHAGLNRANGYYCVDDFSNMSVHAALMRQNRCFARGQNGTPEITGAHAFHLENVKFVRGLTTIALECGIEILDGKLREAEIGEQGIKALHLEDGRVIDGHFFIDASGFRSELLGKALQEPYISYSSTLFNDRAIVGNWDRTNEPILPYTTAETMDSGWCWRIEHERAIHRGYVYSSASISDDAARDEFLRKNPKATTWDRPVQFKSGRYRRCWVKNVMAVGNSGGFVEPLESTGLMVIAGQCIDFVNQIKYVGMTPKVQELFNLQRAKSWDTIRDFLSLHFFANTRLNTPYWQHVRNESDISGIKPLLEAYEDMGPTQLLARLGYAQDIFFGLEGFLVMLVGNKVPYRNTYIPTEAERAAIQTMRARNESIARTGYTVREALDIVKHPSWQWHRDVVSQNA